MLFARRLFSMKGGCYVIFRPINIMYQTVQFGAYICTFSLGLVHECHVEKDILPPPIDHQITCSPKVLSWGPRSSWNWEIHFPKSDNALNIYLLSLHAQTFQTYMLISFCHHFTFNLRKFNEFEEFVPFLIPHQKWAQSYDLHLTTTTTTNLYLTQIRIITNIWVYKSVFH